MMIMVMVMSDDDGGVVTRKGVFVYDWCWTWCIGMVSRPDRRLDNDADPDNNDQL